MMEVGLARKIMIVIHGGLLVVAAGANRRMLGIRIVERPP